ncbi:putative ribonuclease H-like domain-containing protein, partial [Tanacetum coccineum]
FSWVFFLRTKDETSGILKDFIRQIENQLNQKVKSIRCDNGTEFKNSSENQANKHASPQEANQNPSTEDNIDSGDSNIEAGSAQDYFVLPIWSSYTSTIRSSKANNAGAAKANRTNIVNTASTPVSTSSPYGGLSFTDLATTDQGDSEIHALEEIYANPTDGISYDDEGVVADFTNLEPVVNVSPIPTSRINSIHPSTQILRDPLSAVQTRSKVTKILRDP